MSELPRPRGVFVVSRDWFQGESLEQLTAFAATASPQDAL